MDQPFPSPDEPAVAPVTHLSPVVPDPGDGSLLGAAVLAAFGAVALGVDAVGRAVQASSGRTERASEHGTPSGPATAVGATAALTLATGRSAAKAAAAMARGAAFAGNVVVEAGPPVLRRFRDDVGRRAADLDADWRSERVEAEQGARRIGDALVPEVVASVLDTLDLTAIVVERVDLDRVVNEVDMAGLIDRIDIQAIVDRLDIQSIVDRVDIQAIVDRLDLDAIIGKVDLDAIVARVDVSGLARQVIDDLDLPALIRQSTEAVTNESVEGVRVHSAHADRYVQDVVDAVLRRRARGRNPASEPDGAAESPSVPRSDPKDG